MKVAVAGLWHLGLVGSACLAAGGHRVVGVDFDAELIRGIGAGRLPVYEPGLQESIAEGIAAGRLSFSADPHRALAGAEVVWIAYDTPVDDEDRADVGFVVERVLRLAPSFPAGCLALVSSQVPVGTTRSLQSQIGSKYPEKNVRFAYSPENLRLGKAIDSFLRPERVVVGVQAEADRDRITDLFRPFTDRIEWMSLESAEMTKHALNAFFATSIAFINELASLCEAVGADAGEVERGLKSEPRIGPRAYLSAGAAFAGGTLARDLTTLISLGEEHRRPMGLLSSVRASNDEHRLWERRRLQELFEKLDGRKIALWGLTYKPGTDTLRRSNAVELAKWLNRQGAIVTAFDPRIEALPDELLETIQLGADAVSVLSGASALVVATAWPEFLDVGPQALISKMQSPIVLDAGGHLRDSLGEDPRITYSSVGRFRR